jgi:hypothetical protein
VQRGQVHAVAASAGGGPSGAPAVVDAAARAGAGAMSAPAQAQVPATPAGSAVGSGVQPPTPPSAAVPVVFSETAPLMGAPAMVAGLVDMPVSVDYAAPLAALFDGSAGSAGSAGNASSSGATWQGAADSGAGSPALAVPDSRSYC